jgi:hypothetical protein
MRELLSILANEGASISAHVVSGVAVAIKEREIYGDRLNREEGQREQTGLQHSENLQQRKDGLRLTLCPQTQWNGCSLRIG